MQPQQRSPPDPPTRPAAPAGQSGQRRRRFRREDYIRAVLSREVTGVPSLSEILTPFREQVEASGATDEDLARLFSAAREDSYRERNR